VRSECVVGHTEVAPDRCHSQGSELLACERYSGPANASSSGSVFAHLWSSGSAALAIGRPAINSLISALTVSDGVMARSEDDRPPSFPTRTTRASRAHRRRQLHIDRRQRSGGQPVVGEQAIPSACPRNACLTRGRCRVYPAHSLRYFLAPISSPSLVNRPVSPCADQLRENENLDFPVS